MNLHPKETNQHARIDRVPLGEARTKTASGKRAQIIAEYVRYVEQLGEGEAGRLQASEGEAPA